MALAGAWRFSGSFWVFYYRNGYSDYFDEGVEIMKRFLVFVYGAIGSIVFTWLTIGGGTLLGEKSFWDVIVGIATLPAPVVFIYRVVTAESMQNDGGDEIRDLKNENRKLSERIDKLEKK